MNADNATNERPLAVITGGTSGIGLEFAQLCAARGYDLLIAADHPPNGSSAELADLPGRTEMLQVDLAGASGLDAVSAALRSRKVDLLIANAGHGWDKAFLDQDFDDIRHMLDAHVTGMLALVHRIANDMRLHGSGRILITGSVPGPAPEAPQAVYEGTRAFIHSFFWALRGELRQHGITVTCLMPGLTDTDFFERAQLMDSILGTTRGRMDPARVARIGFEAMMNDEGEIVAGLRNKLQSATSRAPSRGRAKSKRRTDGAGSEASD